MHGDSACEWRNATQRMGKTEERGEMSDVDIRKVRAEERESGNVWA